MPSSSTSLLGFVALTLVASASAARPGSTTAILEPATGLAGKEFASTTESTTTPTIQTTARLPASLGGVSALGLSPTCSQSYDTLNQNRAYTDAANDVYQVTREVGQEAGGECESKMQPSANPLGGWCHVAAMKYWTQDETKMAVLPPMRRAADAALPEDERGTVIWLDEDFITKSPTSWLPMLGSEFILKGIMPIYIPGPCVNEADVNGVLGYYGAGCKTEENFASCKFTRHGADE
jgi:hypothetical protein